MNKGIFLFGLLLVTSSAFAQKTVKSKLFTVTTIEQFLDKVGPDRTIELAAEFFFMPTDMKESLVLKDTDNLTIVGVGDKPVRFVTPMPDVPVITFKDCNNIILENIELGHAPEHSTTCDGHVVSFTDCKNIEVKDCFLFGSGFLGISLMKVQDFECSNTTIRGCTGRILTVSESNDVKFSDCTFTDNVGTNEMITFTNSKNVLMENCEVSLNRMEYVEESDMMTGYPIFASEDCKKIKAKGCKIVGNSTPFLFLNKSGMEMEDCRVYSNYVAVKDYKTKD